MIKKVLDDLSSVYLDNVLIYGTMEEDHIRLAKWVMYPPFEAE